MKMWKISIILLIFSYYNLECITSRNPTTNQPVALQLPPAPPQAISNAQQEILSLQQQLKTLTNENSELKNLIQEKKELKTRIKTINTMLQEQLQKNNPMFLELQAKINNKKISPESKKKIMQARQAIKIDHTKLNQLNKNVQGIKSEIHRIAPKRTTILQNLHDAQKRLKELELATQITKIKDRPL